jgi:hypothetical protein
MATQPKVNPTLPNVARHFNGKSITGVTIATGVVMTDEFGANGALQDIYEVMAENATPIIVSQVRTPGTTSAEFDVYFEGDFLEVDDYGTSNDASFVADLQVRIKALGATAAVRDAVTAAASGETESAGVNLADATATAITAIVDDTTGTAGLVGDGGVDIS